MPVSPGQDVCRCVDEMMWQRLLIEMLCRRIVALEREVQSGGDPQRLTSFVLSGEAADDS